MLHVFLVKLVLVGSELSAEGLFVDGENLLEDGVLGVTQLLQDSLEGVVHVLVTQRQDGPNHRVDYAFLL